LVLSSVGVHPSIPKVRLEVKTLIKNNDYFFGGAAHQIVVFTKESVVFGWTLPAGKREMMWMQV
jgi:hypothetical protein